MTDDLNAVRQVGSRSPHRRLGRPEGARLPELDEQVAAAMVRRLLAEHPGLVAAAKEGGSVTILAIHDREWVLPIRRAWITALWVDDGPDEIVTWPLAAAADDEKEDKAREPRWHGFTCNDAARKVDHRSSQGNLIDAFQSGKPVYGWSHDPDVLLPPELRRMADRVLQIPLRPGR
ncbi:hypothetical protein [Dankookia sp. P2]|uniref:hypothetical protein n=1 Tax=Dankookia sp. P2 TaxID=3423955 RepID=UPI003D6654A8